jgi:hypothetical protein
MVLPSLHGCTPACQLGEVAPTVAVQRGPPPEASPTRANLLERLGFGPFLEGLLADGSFLKMGYCRFTIGVIEAPKAPPRSSRAAGEEMPISSCIMRCLRNYLCNRSYNAF